MLNARAQQLCILWFSYCSLQNEEWIYSFSTAQKKMIIIYCNGRNCRFMYLSQLKAFAFLSSHPLNARTQQTNKKKKLSQHYKNELKINIIVSILMQSIPSTAAKKAHHTIDYPAIICTHGFIIHVLRHTNQTQKNDSQPKKWMFCWILTVHSVHALSIH